MIWFFCVPSSFLAYSYKSSPKGTTSQFAWAVSIDCRLMAKTLTIAAMTGVMKIWGRIQQGIGWMTLDAFVLKGKCHLYCFICNNDFIREPARV